METEALFTVGDVEDAQQIVIGESVTHSPIGEVINAILLSAARQTEAELKPVVQALEDSCGTKCAAVAESMLSTIVCRLAKATTVDEVVQFVLLSHDVFPVASDQVIRLINAIATKCIVEICAVNEAILEDRRGVPEKQILRDITKRINGKTYRPDCLSEAIDPNREEEFDDRDPINGIYVNKLDEKLQAQRDAAKTEKEKEEIHKKCVTLYKKEAKKNNPLALFYLGVLHLTGGGVTKDLQKGRALLEQAHKMGVRQAEGFLLSYFEDYKAEG